MLERGLGMDPGDPARALLVAAAVCEAVGRSFVVVGGSAVSFHTGSYRPTDIGFVGPIDEEGRTRLTALGFRASGRHLVIDSPQGGVILIEFPAEELFGFATEPPERIEVAEGVVVEVIALDDLMMDRLIQATDGTPVALGEAVLLAVAAYRRIDWGSLERRAASAGVDVTASAARLLPGVLGRVRGTARRLIREGRSDARHDGDDRPGG